MTASFVAATMNVDFELSRFKSRDLSGRMTTNCLFHSAIFCHPSCIDTVYNILTPRCGDMILSVLPRARGRTVHTRTGKLGFLTPRGSLRSTLRFSHLSGRKYRGVVGGYPSIGALISLFATGRTKSGNASVLFGCRPPVVWASGFKTFQNITA